MSRKVAARPGDVIKRPEDTRHWVVLKITQKIIDSTAIDVPKKPGYYCFGGMWYGDEPMCWASYGKMIRLKEPYEVVGHVDDIGLIELRNMVG